MIAHLVLLVAGLAATVSGKVDFKGHPPMPYHHGPPNTNGSFTLEEGKEFLAALQHNYTKNTAIALKQNATAHCNSNNVLIRRAWDDLDEFARAEYIRAVKCLARQPARTDVNLVPGVRNWIDDFVWQHINMTNYVHVSGLLLPWHRQLTFAWEKSLRDQCGYQGALPYWPWERHALNLSESPVFGPGPTAFGSNGAYVPHGEIVEPFIGLPPPGLNVSRAPAHGGGFVMDGAFGNNTDWTLNLGPVTPVNNSVWGSNNTAPYELGQRYNPRALKRDIYQEAATELLNYIAVAHLMRQDSIHTFHPTLENNGVHIGGHFYVGGDGGDIYTSPNEPLFWLHHANIDRLWSIWQGQDYANRLLGLDGTLTVANIPPSKNATLEDIMHMGIPAGGDIPIREAMSTIQHGHCYMYM